MWCFINIIHYIAGQASITLFSFQKSFHRISPFVHCSKRHDALFSPSKWVNMSLQYAHRISILHQESSRESNSGWMHWPQNLNLNSSSASLVELPRPSLIDYRENICQVNLTWCDIKMPPWKAYITSWGLCKALNIFFRLLHLYLTLGWMPQVKILHELRVNSRLTGCLLVDAQWCGIPTRLVLS